MVEQRNSRNVRNDTTIRETPGIVGGFPRVGNTRVPVRTVVEAYKAIGNIRRTKTDALPQLTHRQVRDALAYYNENPVRVDEDIQRNQLDRLIYH